MTTAARRQRHREETRAEILTAAREIFVRAGFDSFSMRTLARALGCSPAAIYLHFTSKEKLFDALVEASFAHLDEALDVLLKERATDPMHRLKRGMRLYVEWGLKYPSEYQIAFVVRNPTKKPYRTHSAFDAARALVKSCLSSSVAGRELELRTQALWAAIHGIASLLTLRASFPWVSKQGVVDQVIESAVQGALSPARGGKSKRKK